jgi:hypothetical protein
MTQGTSGSTSENWIEYLSSLIVDVIVFGLNPGTVAIGMILLIIPSIPPAMQNQPIVGQMMWLGMIQYVELWILFIYIRAEHDDHGWPITPRDIGAALLDTIPFFGLAFYALLHPMNIVLKILLVIYGTCGWLPTMMILAGLFNAPWLLPGGLLEDP